MKDGRVQDQVAIHPSGRYAVVQEQLAGDASRFADFRVLALDG